jgi:protein phosphatase
MIKYTALTHIGNYKSNNEDYFYCSGNKDENLIYIVCDGVGGYSGGEIASRFATEYIVKNFAKIKYQFKNPISCLKEITFKANQELLLEQRKSVQYSRMGTTISLAWIVSQKMYFITVGDTRIYLIRDGLEQLSSDQNILWNKYLMGKLTKEEMRLHPENNIITAMLGRPKLEINSGKTDLKNNDKILICSDGLTDMIPESDIEKIFIAHNDIKLIGHKLLDKALENGGKDNITLEILAYEISK